MPSIGQPAARMRWRILFHSIWNATSVGTRSSTSDALASSTASVSSGPSYQRRRRAGASASSQDSTSIPAASNTWTSWPITISAAPTIPSGRRRIEYRNAPRSSSSLPASGCRLDPIARCDGSSTRSRVSPLERSSVVYVRW